MALDFDAWERSDAARRFHCFDPYMTYAKADNDKFVHVNGKPGKKLNPDTWALFLIGKEAFTRMSHGEGFSEDVFRKCFLNYWKCIDNFRALLEYLNEEGCVLFEGDDGQPVISDVTIIDNTEVIPLCWKWYLDIKAIKNKADTINLTKADNLFRDLFLLHALREIDNALVGMDLDGREVVAAAIGAANALSNAIAIESGNEKEQEIKRDMAYRGAIEKLKRDPKQVAKSHVKECWNEWQLKPTNYGSKSAFAKDMMAKFEELDSQTVITRWCGKWERDE